MPARSSHIEQSLLFEMIQCRHEFGSGSHTHSKAGGILHSIQHRQVFSTQGKAEPQFSRAVSQILDWLKIQPSTPCTPMHLRFHIHCEFLISAGHLDHLFVASFRMLVVVNPLFFITIYTIAILQF